MAPPVAAAAPSVWQARVPAVPCTVSRTAVATVPTEPPAHAANQCCQVAAAALAGAAAALAGRGLRRSRRGRARTRRSASAASAVPGAKLSLFSPAKVNLFLRIIRRRPDGYHDLASLFHTISLGDELDLEVLPESATHDELKCNLPGVPVDDSNLVIRALKLFRDRSGLKNFFRIRLEKRIPAQAGMGGGSSNAAAAFYGANVLSGRPASPAELLKWADDPVIGSDASFFLSEGTAYCTGRGEIVEPVGPLPVPPGLGVFLVKPKYGLSTGKVFQAMDLSKLSTVDPAELLQAWKEKGAAHGIFVNDLEPPAFKVSPDLGELKRYLSDPASGFGFQAVLMSGSGSTIYCLGDPKSGAATFEAEVKGRFEIEGIWRSQLIRRPNLEDWYEAPKSGN